MSGAQPMGRGGGGGGGGWHGGHVTPTLGRPKQINVILPPLIKLSGR